MAAVGVLMNGSIMLALRVASRNGLNVRYTGDDHHGLDGIAHHVDAPTR